MRDQPRGGNEAALRALHAADREIELLRSSGLTPEERRGCVLRIANAVDRCLRRLLRDDERVDLELRLKALAPDELRVDEVLAELRRTERFSVRLAASIHELFTVRQRLESAPDASPDDGERAIQVAEQIEVEILTIPIPAFVAEPRPLDLEVEPAPVEPPRLQRRQRRRIPVWPMVTVALVLLALFLALRRTSSGPDQMEQGIALFEEGEYQEAAQYFWRYAEAHPQEVAPHLYLARIHRRMQRFELAAGEVRIAEELAPDDAAVQRESGFLLLDTDQAPEAIERFEIAVDLDRNSPEGWVGLARALREAGRADEIPAAIVQAPAEIRALLNRPAPG